MWKWWFIWENCDLIGKSTISTGPCSIAILTWPEGSWMVSNGKCQSNSWRMNRGTPILGNLQVYLLRCVFFSSEIVRSKCYLRSFKHMFESRKLTFWGRVWILGGACCYLRWSRWRRFFDLTSRPSPGIMVNVYGSYLQMGQEFSLVKYDFIYPDILLYWLVVTGNVWNHGILNDFPFSWECHHPNWWTHIYPDTARFPFNRNPDHPNHEVFFTRRVCIPLITSWDTTRSENIWINWCK